MKKAMMNDKEYYQRNRERILERQKVYERENYNPEKRSQKYLKNRQIIIKQVREYRESNIDKSKIINNNNWKQNPCTFFAF